MATYEELYGKRVKEFDSDPTLESSYEGQVWYDKSTGVVKSVVSAGAWSSTASAINGASSPMGFGIQTAAVMAGGATGPGNQSYVEEYNGSGFSTGGALPAVRQDGGGAGTETAGVVWCGEGSTKLNTTQEYNGSSWTTTNTYPITARGVRGSGTQTAAIGCGGDTTAPAASNVSAEYDGSSWTAGNNLPGNRVAAATSGPQTSALATTGKDNTPNPSVSNLNTSYDGTSWTAQTVYPLSLRQASSTGTSSSANLVAGGVGATPFGDAVTTAAQWNGSSWTTTGSLGTKSTHMGYAGTSTAAIIRGGAQDYPSYPGVAQEFNQSINRITAAAWSSGDNMPAVVYRNTGFGTQTAGVVAGGSNTSAQPSTTNAFKYDGSSWTSTGALGTARRGLMSAGTQTAGLVFAGSGGGSDSNVNNESEEFNGSTFSEGNNCNTSVSLAGGSGSQTSAVKAGGYTGSGNSSSSEEYDGTSWTSGNSINTARRSISQVGEIPNAKLIGGETSGSGQVTNVEDYDGTNWTNGTALITADKGAAAAAGTPSACIISFGRNSSSVVATTQGWDGTSWFTQPTGATARAMVGGNGTSTAAFIAGGETSSLVANTENFDGESSAITASTLTSS